MERQSHGFIYQDKKCEEHGLIQDTEYTGIWDAYTKDNIPCVIKTFKKGSEMPLSDIFINSNRNKDFYLIYGVWEGCKSNIIEEKMVFIDINKWKTLFDWEFYDDLKFWIKFSVKNDKSYDNIWKSEVKKWKIKWGGKRIVQPRFKRDHKQQRRVQSAINYKKINIFLEYAKK
jgi:hypothetical protein